MGELLEIARNVFDERGWGYRLVPEHDALRFPFRGDDDQWECFVKADDEDRRLAVYSVCPFNVPEEQRGATAELLSRINYGLVIGNFEMDLDDGQVRFKTSIDVQGTELSEAHVERLVFPNLRTMNIYLGAITAMVGGGLSPAEALGRVDDVARKPS